MAALKEIVGYSDPLRLCCFCEPVPLLLLLELALAPVRPNMDCFQLWGPGSATSLLLRFFLLYSSPEKQFRVARPTGAVLSAPTGNGGGARNSFLSAPAHIQVQINPGQANWSCFGGFGGKLLFAQANPTAAQIRGGF